MFKDSTSKVVRNKFLFQQEEQYVKSNKVKSKIKSKIKQESMPQEKITKLSTMQNYSKPQNLQLIGFDEQDQFQQQMPQSQAHKENVNPQKENRKLQKEENLINKNQIIKNQTTKTVKTQLTKTVPKQNYNLSNQNNQVGLKKKQNFFFTQSDPLKQVTNQTEEKNQIYNKRSRQDRKKIFNIELSDSNSQQEQISKQTIKQKVSDKVQQIFDGKQVQYYIRNQQQKRTYRFQGNDQFQKQQKIYNQINQFQTQQNKQNNSQIFQTTNIFDGSKSQNREVSNKFHVDISESSSQQQVKQAIITPRNLENKKKIILNDFGSDSDQGNQSNQNKKEDQEYLQIIRNINITKLKKHFQIVKIDPNFLAFCPIPHENKISLVIKRDTKNSSYTIFDNELVCLVMKIQKTIGGTYKFLMPQDLRNPKSEAKTVGKMKANFLGTEFHCYTNKEQNKEKYQCISLKYDVNILGLNGPRKTKIYATTKPLPSQMNLLETYQKNRGKSQLGIKTYQNKTPKWIPELNAYVLNLRGTANHSSIKNCIIVDSTNENKQHIIFGKKSKDIFNLQVKHPFTVLQGAAFAVSSFQRKLACQ